tara:strand:+ start:115 stop:444 length:330 start_codon:yes stop_codon:yes gene_type:complete
MGVLDPLAKEFGLKALEAWMEGGNVDVDDGIINFITFPCASQVVDDANQMDYLISKKLRFGDQGGPDLVYSNTDIPQNIENSMVLGKAIPLIYNEEILPLLQLNLTMIF